MSMTMTMSADLITAITHEDSVTHSTHVGKPPHSVGTQNAQAHAK